MIGEKWKVFNCTKKRGTGNYARGETKYDKGGDENKRDMEKKKRRNGTERYYVTRNKTVRRRNKEMKEQA